MADGTILTSAIFMQIILPFVLVFTLIYAILQRTKILGEGQKRIDSITALVIGVIVVAYTYSTSIITKLMPFLAVAAVIILIFMILFGFVSGDKEGFKMNKGLRITFGILIGLALIIAVIISTGYWDVFVSLFTGENSNSIVINIVFIGIIIAAIATVVGGKKSGKTE